MGRIVWYGGGVSGPAWVFLGGVGAMVVAAGVIGYCIGSEE